MIFQLLDKIKNCKGNSTTQDVLESIKDHLTTNVTFSTWNLSKHAKNYIKSRFDCIAGNHDQNSKDPNEDHVFAMLMYIFDTDVPFPLVEAYKYTEPFNWATDSIGSWIVKSIVIMRYSCMSSNKEEYETMINDFFTVKDDVISLLDISQLFLVMDLAALDLKVDKKIYISWNVLQLKQLHFYRLIIVLNIIIIYR